ncbi:MAG: acylneuraminate cytidylyltransferase family protein [Schwartzia succinivorans]|jgi:CMP-N,N'-diacetyllegionaminic acid synthase|uniref:acylneuraminate cytidylyltransferase family protein n=1 Tax=Schwartzia succinivorans TaxID=55507 RepID=UPI00235406C7|nr:acylneuraminate cytidylyltransferase family protein [Schwartzia succinivorans]MBE6097708.1 acylneuraminate cytidylyltransferase family protein [Schwartzia succinivorans]
MTNIAIIPARSGSKGLKDKNIKLMNGKPLLSYSIVAAKESGIFDEIMVSTDSQRYADIAIKYGASVPFLRSSENSSDTADSWDMVLEVLNNYRELGSEFDTICLLQPTSPLRIGRDISEAYKDFRNNDVDALTSVCEVDHSPLWTMMLAEDRMLTEYRKHSSNAPRQKLATYYRVNGAIYIRKIEYSKNGINLLDAKEIAFIMDKIRSVDIDDELDFAIGEYLMSKV